MGYSKILPPKPKRYYARHKRLPIAAKGEVVEVLVTRYTYATGVRPEQGPRGGRNGRKFYREVMYCDGTFYKVGWDKGNDDEKWPRALIPITGRIWDCHQQQSAEQGVPEVMFELVEGRPVQVKYGGVWMHCDGMDPCLEDDLSLNKRKRRSPRVTRK